jgi:ABC-type phosphate/phosphonate transport system permease subunit
MGIVLAAAVAQWRVSDVTISAWQAVWAGLTQMLAYQIAVWITVVASWLGVHVALLARRRTTAG